MRRVQPLTWEALQQLPLARRRAYVAKLRSLPLDPPHAAVELDPRYIYHQRDERYNKLLRLAKVACRS